MKSHFFKFLVIASMAICLVGCGGTGGKQLGTWEVEKASIDGSEYTLDELKALGKTSLDEAMLKSIIVIKAGADDNSGSAIIHSGDENATVKWEMSGDKIKIGQRECTIEGDYIVLGNDKNDNKLFFHKTSESQDASSYITDSEDNSDENEEATKEPEPTETPTDDGSDDNTEAESTEEEDSGDEYTPIEVELTGDEYTYEDLLCRDNEKGKVIIVQYKGNDSRPTIPSEIYNKKVVAIGPAAFAGNTSVEKIYNWADINEIGAGAFQGCTELEEFSVSSDVDIIKESTFEGCSSLKRAYLWGDIKTFEKNAFKGCKSLKEISISSSNETIGESAFEGCTKLGKVYFWGGERIESAAFKDCKSLKELSLSSDTEYIGDEAFYGCDKLKKVRLWNDDCDVASDAFDNCPNLTEHP